MKDRRELLKVLGVTGATGAVWKQPVINAVILPAHAMTSAASVTYSLTGGVQEYLVPLGVSSVRITAYGAKGGDAGIVVGGDGGMASGILSVTPEETLYVYVGGQGEGFTDTGNSPDRRGLGGFNGGGDAGLDCNSDQSRGGGGGASDVRQGGSGMTNRVIVAGGGGGGGDGQNSGGTGAQDIGGNGGGDTGGPGVSGSNPPGSTGGTQSAGGMIGTTAEACASGTDGSLGQGGQGSGNDGGGGGGGYYGGAGGAGNGGGGGGSGYIGGVTSGSMSSGANSGDGMITIDPL